MDAAEVGMGVGVAGMDVVDVEGAGSGETAVRVGVWGALEVWRVGTAGVEVRRMGVAESGSGVKGESE